MKKELEVYKTQDQKKFMNLLERFSYQPHYREILLPSKPYERRCKSIYSGFKRNLVGWGIWDLSKYPYVLIKGFFLKEAYDHPLDFIN